MNSLREDVFVCIVGYFRERRVNLVKMSVKIVLEWVINIRVWLLFLSFIVMCFKSDKYVFFLVFCEDFEKS